MSYSHQSVWNDVGQRYELISTTFPEVTVEANLGVAVPTTDGASTHFKGGASFWYCAYVLRVRDIRVSQGICLLTQRHS